MDAFDKTSFDALLEALPDFQNMDSGDIMDSFLLDGTDHEHTNSFPGFSPEEQKQIVETFHAYHAQQHQSQAGPTEVRRGVPLPPIKSLIDRYIMQMNRSRDEAVRFASGRKILESQRNDLGPALIAFAGPLQFVYNDGESCLSLLGHSVFRPTYGLTTTTSSSTS